MKHMNQHRYGEHSHQQGAYGEKKTDVSNNLWICPKCETVNTGAACIVCGYKKENFKNRWKIIAAGLVVAAILITGALFLLPSSWRETDGNLYYYHMGRKTVGEAEIDGEMYFFDEKGVMHTGWRQASDQKYYYKSDGTMATGFQKIDEKDYYFTSNGTMKTGWLRLNGSQYYLDADGSMKKGTHIIGTGEYSFDDHGRLMQRKYRLNEIPGSTTSKEDTGYIKNDKTAGAGRYQVLDKPIENCAEITVTINVSDLKAGNVGDWGFYIRDLAGRWKRCGDITLNNNTGSARFFFDSPVESFDAYVCFCESLGKHWDFAFTQELSDIMVVEFF